MSKQNIESFLRDITYNSKFTILEEGKDDSEMKAIAEKRGIVLPAKDLSVFKCIYAYTDRTNLNGCLLPKDEVEKSLQTLVGKAIDFDHVRGRIVGSWIDAKVEGNQIIAYGIFYKGNLQDDYQVISDLLQKNQLMISFEAYGNREFTDEGTYSLNDIEWAGGALLIDTNPAFPGAAVLEMSNKQVLEFAKVMTPPKEFVHSKVNKENKGETKMTEAKKEETSSEELNKDEEGTIVDPKADLEADIKAEEKAEVKPEEKAEEKKEEVKEEATTVKCPTCGSLVDHRNICGTSPDIAKLQEEIAALKVQIEKKDAELASKVEEAKKVTATLIERKSVLKEFAKDMKDEDILNDDKYEIAKLKKENSDLKAIKLEKSSLEVGGEEKKEEVTPEAEKGKKEDKELELQKKIQGKAWK